MATAAERNEEARRLLTRGRLREALDVLNQGIRLAPRYGPFFATRAEVFQQLNLVPQAASDRRRAAALGTPPEEPPEPPEPPDASIQETPRRTQPAPAKPAPRATTPAETPSRNLPPVAAPGPPGPAVSGGSMDPETATAAAPEPTLEGAYIPQSDETRVDEAPTDEPASAVGDAAQSVAARSREGSNADESDVEAPAPATGESVKGETAATSASARVEEPAPPRRRPIAALQGARAPSKPAPIRRVAPSGSQAEAPPRWSDAPPETFEDRVMNVLRVMPLRTLSVVFAGAGVVLLLVVAVDALTGGGDGGSLAAVPTSSALGGEASPTPANTGADTEGVPYSLSSLERVWRAAGMTVTTGGTSEGFEGFEGRPLNIKIERDGSEMKFSVFVYSDPQQAGRDWSLASGEVPVPNAASTTPDHVTSWYNTNIVIVVLTDSAALHADALSGVSELTP